MKRSLSSGALAVCAVLAIGMAVPGAGATLALPIRDLGTLSGGRSQGNAVNDFGEVAGFSSNSSVVHAVRWDSDRSIHPLAFLGTGISAQALGINDLGQTVGFSRTEAPLFGSPLHAVLWDRAGTATDLDPGGFRSQASGINNYGQVSGSLRTSGGDFIAVRWDVNRGTRIDLPTLPGGPVTVGLAINARGEMVGHSGERAVRWDANGNITALAMLPGETESEAVDISDTGEIVGFSSGSDSGHIVLWEPDGTIIDLGAGIPTGINAQGQVVGTTDHATLWDRTGAKTDLGALPPGGGNSAATAISNYGPYISGFSDTPGNDPHAVRWG